MPKNDNRLFIWIFSDALGTQNVPETQKYFGDDMMMEHGIRYFPVKLNKEIGLKV